MRQLTFPLDALPALREATGNRDVDLAAAVSLAELSGVDAVRLTVTEELRPVRNQDVQEARRAAQSLELRMPPTQAALKVALEGRPDLVVLASEGWDGQASGRPSMSLVTMLRTCAGVGSLSERTAASTVSAHMSSPDSFVCGLGPG